MLYVLCCLSSLNTARLHIRVHDLSTWRYMPVDETYTHTHEHDAARYEGLLPEDLHWYRWHAKECRKSSVAWTAWVVHMERSAQRRALPSGPDDHLQERSKKTSESASSAKTTSPPSLHSPQESNRKRRQTPGSIPSEDSFAEIDQGRSQHDRLLLRRRQAQVAHVMSDVRGCQRMLAWQHLCIHCGAIYDGACIDNHRGHRGQGTSAGLLWCCRTACQVERLHHADHARKPFKWSCMNPENTESDCFSSSS